MHVSHSIARLAAEAEGVANVREMERDQLHGTTLNKCIKYSETIENDTAQNTTNVNAEDNKIARNTFGTKYFAWSLSCKYLE